MTKRPTLIGLPYDASSSYLRGAANAPNVIRAALASPGSNAWTEDGHEIVLGETYVDAGDVDLSPPAEARASIESAIGEIVERGDVPLSLGGDHSVTYPIMRAIARVHPDVTILQIDAHPDLYE